MMESLGVYLLKASAILALFWGSYQLWLKRETLFGHNRVYLLTGLLTAVLLPLVRIPQEIVVKGTVLASLPQTPLEHAPEAAASEFPWETALWTLYLAGALGCLWILGRELFKLYRLVRSEDRFCKDGLVHIPTRSTEAPFSFFRYIFYNPERHSEAELAMILEHERAHSAQWHSLDILLGRIATAVLWMNPLSWRYQKSIQQNLEYLADATAVRKVKSAKAYQYCLLRVSGNTLTPALATPFYSSLIKKRITMLNSHPSKTISIVKHLLIVPVLALFLMAFSREPVYITETPFDAAELPIDKVLEFRIDKDTSEEELNKMKATMAEDSIDFSYTTVRNEAGEIIQLEFDFNGKAANGNPFSGSFTSDSDGPIEPVLIRINDTGGIVFGNAQSISERSELHFSNKRTKGIQSNVWVYDSEEGDREIIEIREKDGEEVIIVDGKEVERNEWSDEGGTKKIMVKLLEVAEDSDADIEIHKLEVRDENTNDRIVELHPGKDFTRTVEIVEKDGKKIIEIDGEEVSEEAYEEMMEEGSPKTKKIRVRTSDAPRSERIIVVKESEDEEDMEVITDDVKGFAFFNSDSKADPLFFIDGKKANEKKVRALDPKRIERIEVLKGGNAVEEYGRKAKNGVVLITTKKE